MTYNLKTTIELFNTAKHKESSNIYANGNRSFNDPSKSTF